MKLPSTMIRHGWHNLLRENHQLLKSNHHDEVQLVWFRVRSLGIELLLTG